MWRRLLVTAATAFALAGPAYSQVNPGDLKWGPAPPMFAPGAQLAVVSGNPMASGPFVVRLRMPANYRIAAHFHPTTENVTVISGTFHIGMGDRLDTSKGAALSAGGFAQAPAQMHHYAWTTEPAEVQVHADGPFALTYVNPADDPRGH